MINGVSGVSVGSVGGRIDREHWIGGATAPTRSGQTESAAGLGDQIGQALGAMSAAEHRADLAAQGAATGDLASVSEFMMATTEAQLMAEVTVAVRNRGIEAFNEIMRMQV